MKYLFWHHFASAWDWLSIFASTENAWNTWYLVTCNTDIAQNKQSFDLFSGTEKCKHLNDSILTSCFIKDEVLLLNMLAVGCFGALGPMKPISVVLSSKFGTTNCVAVQNPFDFICASRPRHRKAPAGRKGGVGNLQ